MMAQKFDNVTLSRKEIFFNNVIGGIGWAVGATFGFSILLTIIGLLSKELGFVPILGDLLKQLSTVHK